MRNQIKRLREARALTQEELASRVGTSFQQISRLESGQRKLSQEWMDRISAALGVHPYLLIDDSLMPGVEPHQAVGEFIDLPDELAWLRLFRAMTHDERAFSVRLLSKGLSKSDVG